MLGAHLTQLCSSGQFSAPLTWLRAEAPAHPQRRNPGPGLCQQWLLKPLQHSTAQHRASAAHAGSAHPHKAADPWELSHRQCPCSLVGVTALLGRICLGWSFPSGRQGRTPRLQGDVWEAPCCPQQGWVPGFRVCRRTRRTSPGSAGCHPGTASWGCRSRTRSAQGCSSTTPTRTAGRRPLGRTENRELKCFCCTEPFPPSLHG